MLRAFRTCLILVAVALCVLASATTVFESQALRIQVLSPTLVRVEEKGPKGYEDRVTFAVVRRAWPGAKVALFKSKHGIYSFVLGKFRVAFDPGAQHAQDVVVERQGTRFSVLPQPQPSQFFPPPGHFPKVYSVEDNPRIVPPREGAVPVSASDPFAATSGWDTGNQARDCYLFLNQGGGYAQFRKDYLRLTGPIELPPLYAFGLIDSRYFPYTQDAATKVVQTYRERGFPLDMFVLDTDWRVGASKGYEVNTKLWPDLSGFVRALHSMGVRSMVNDHPEPLAPQALDPEETKGRWEGVTKLLGLGVDAWWYDRNWITHLREPVPGLAPEIWGERVYHDVTAKFRPNMRPMIMSNVQGIDNGVKNSAPQVGFHRYPIHWTGDTSAQWTDLERGVRNAVDGGVDSLLPYIGEDIGGHRGKPDAELYTRFVQYGCLSPTMRLHCTAGESRFPWDFGKEAESIALDYVKLRYRLLPVIYGAARQAYDTGTPLLRRCDLIGPGTGEADSSLQYMLGDDLLVAPIVKSKDGNPGGVPSSMFKTSDGRAGVEQSVFQGTKFEDPSSSDTLVSNVAFSSSRPADAHGLSIRWKTRIGPVPESGEYIVGVACDAGVKVLWDGNLLVSKFKEQTPATYFKPLQLEKGKSYDVVVEYQSKGRTPHCQLLWTVPSKRKSTTSISVWIPPGGWVDAWTGETLTGPRTITVDVGLAKVPMFVRQGSVLTLAHEVSSTQHGVWDRPVLNINLAGGNFRCQTSLYEDDGLSTAYQRGGAATTSIKVRSAKHKVRIEIGPAQGTYQGMPGTRRWEIKLVTPRGLKASGFKVDGVALAPEIRKGNNDMPFSLRSGTFLNLPPTSVRKKRIIEFTLRGAA